jgi:hypothetical protein
MSVRLRFDEAVDRRSAQSSYVQSDVDLYNVPACFVITHRSRSAAAGRRPTVLSQRGVPRRMSAQTRDSGDICRVRPHAARALRQNRLRVRRLPCRRHQSRAPSLFRKARLQRPRARLDPRSDATVQRGPEELSGRVLHLRRRFDGLPNR